MVIEKFSVEYFYKEGIQAQEEEEVDIDIVNEEQFAIDLFDIDEKVL